MYEPEREKEKESEPLNQHTLVSQAACGVLAMLLTVFCAPRDRGETTFALDVSPDLELRDFVALCELESGIPAGEIQVIHIKYK